MATRKRNEFLDGDESEEEIDRGYDSDAAEESRGAIGGRGSKRRKVDSDDEELASDDDKSFHSLDVDDGEPTEAPKNPVAISQSEEAAAPIASITKLDHSGFSAADFATTAATTPKQFAAAAKAARKSGVLYISRVPPFMKPQTLRHFLTPYAQKGLGRIFLTPEDHVAHARRVRSGGNKKKSYTDGWVEFTSKTEAKDAAEMLNGNIIGGKKGNFYHDDLWNVKYLHGFKWADLTEQISTENAERAARLREEVRKTRKENKAFVQDVERGKMLEGVERTKAARGEGDEEASTEGKKRRAMEFKQRKVKSRDKDDRGKKQSADLTRVLGKIF